MGKLPAFRRIAIAVRNLDRAKALYETLLGARFEPPALPFGEEVRLVEWRRAGLTVELVQPVDEDGAVARFIRKRGEGVHHLSFAVPDLEAALSRIAAAGGRVVRAGSYYRAPEGEGLTEAFVHPKDAHGTLIHLVEEG